MPTAPAKFAKDVTVEPIELDSAGCVLSRLARRKRGPELEAAILAAAFEELTEVGYTAFSFESVAARARTGKASIYRRWPSKPDLVLDSMSAHLPTPQECLGPVFDDSVTTIDALHEVARTIAAMVSSPAGDAIRAIKGLATADIELARAIDDRFNAPRREAMLGLLSRGVARGEVRPEAVCENVAEAMPALIMYRVLMLRDQLTEADVVQIVDEVLVPILTIT